jgi:hypothetical protein
MASARLFGASQMIRKLKEIAAKFPDHVAAALYQEAEIEATEMKRRTPVDTTPHAIHVEEPERRGRNISVTIATGAEAPYAIYVHENPDAIHPVGEWKFMESVLNESAPHMAERLGRRVDLNKMRV